MKAKYIKYVSKRKSFGDPSKVISTDTTYGEIIGQEKKHGLTWLRVKTAEREIIINSTACGWTWISREEFLTHVAEMVMDS